MHLSTVLQFKCSTDCSYRDYHFFSKNKATCIYFPYTYEMDYMSIYLNGLPVFRQWHVENALIFAKYAGFLF